MDPAISLSMRLGPLCGLTLKQISNISEVINPAPRVPEAAQNLSNELASLYSSLGRLRIAIHTPRADDFPGNWHGDIDQLVTDCNMTLNDIQTALGKSRVTRISSSPDEVWKEVRLSFNKKQLELMNGRVVAQNGILHTLFSAFSETRKPYIEDRLEYVHDKVEKLSRTREQVREAWGVSPTRPADNKGVDSSSELLAALTLGETSIQTPSGQGDLKLDGLPPGDDIKTEELPKGTEELEGKNKDVDDAASESSTTFSKPTLFQYVQRETKLSDMERKAISLMKHHVWSVSRYRELKSDLTWKEYDPSDSTNRTPLRCKLTCCPKEGLALTLMDKDGKLLDRLTGYWPDGTFVRNGMVVSDAPPEYEGETGWTTVEATFSTVQEAKDFDFCVSTMLPRVHRARKLYMAALLSNDTFTDRELSQLAYRFKVN